jgi:thioredoxin-like negative regulator of GroEL
MISQLAKRSTSVRVMRGVCFAIILPFVAGACSSSTTTSDQSDETEQVSESTNPADSMPSSSVDTTSAGAYITLADFQASQETYSESKVVLFFTATWCSTCKKARSNLESDLSAIPSDLTIVLVDFDSETDLKRQYGITVQHTFVQIDTDGSELAKWSGSLTAQEIVENTI